MSTGPQVFEVVLVKEGTFGVRVDEVDGGMLRVKAVEPDGCIAKLNQASPDLAICAGDLITSMDGSQEGLTASLAGAAQGQSIRLIISRDAQQVAAPRPQVMGAEERGECHSGKAQAAPKPIPQWMVAGAAAARRPPPGVPPGSRLEQDKYPGVNTKVSAACLCLCCGPLAAPCILCLLASPIDERDVYIAPNGEKFTKSGAWIG